MGHTVFGVETAAAAAGVEPLKTRLYAEGAAPLRAALDTLARTVCAAPAAAAESAAVTAARRALEYSATPAARLDYPAFVARRFPIGSGAVESRCKGVVHARTKGAGLRWSGDGAQRVVAWRALHRAGRWDTFWQAPPPRARLLLFPRARQRPAAPTAASPPLVTPPVVADPAPPTPPRATAPAPPRLLRPADARGERRQSIGRARAA